MKARIIKKVGIIILAVLILISSIFAWIKLSPKSDLEYMTEAQKARYAEYDQLETEDIENCQYVKFGAFFTKDLNGDGVAEKMLGTCNQVNGTDTLYISVGVAENGYLKDGVITVNSSNFKYSTELVKDTVLKYNYVSNNTKRMELNDVYAGSGKILMGNIYSLISDGNAYSKINSVTLTGTHVSDDEEPVETVINKTIEFDVDWYGTATTYAYSNVKSIIKTQLVEGNDIDVTLNVTVNTTGLISKTKHLDIEIPTLLDYYPTSVTADMGDLIYDSTNHTCTLTHDTSMESSTYTITLTYPAEVYEFIMLELQTKQSIIITSNVNAYTECYNNPNDGFDNPYITNTYRCTASTRIQNPVVNDPGEVYQLSMSLVDKQKVTYPYTMYAMSKTNILEQYDSANPTNIGYTVNWNVHRLVATNGTSVMYMEDRDNRGDYFNNVYLDTCFKNVGIYFGDTHLLAEDESVKIYNSKTGEIVKELKNGSWADYNSSNPYYFDVPFEDLKIEFTEDCTHTDGFEVYLKRQFDISTMQTVLTRTQIERASYFYTAVNFSGTYLAGKAMSDYCELLDQKSRATLSLSRNSIEAGIASPVNQTISISVPPESITDAPWKNGSFLVRFPADKIGSFKVTDVTSSNSQVRIGGYDFYKQGNYYFIKVFTNSELVSNGFTINIRHEFLPDTMASNGTIRYELYSQNEYSNIYYNSTNDVLDMDGDGNTTEKVTYSSFDYSVLAPTSFVTSEKISEYNDNSDFTIAPNVALVSNNQRTAKISVLFANNYTNNVSDVVIIGRIPFEGNTFISGQDLKSEFSTYMINGISIPDSLDGRVSIYYSEKGDTNKDLTDTTNGWIPAEDVTSFENIKTYLIVIDSDAVLRRQTYEFSYEISIPENTILNGKAFSCHSIYYDLNTEGGTLPLEVHPNKLGLRVVSYYDLDITKVKKGTLLAVPEAKYQILEVNEEEEDDELNRILISDTNGKITISNLRANQVYSFKEISAPNNYELNEDDIIFKVVQGDNGLQIQYITEKTFGDLAQINIVNGRTVLSANVEDEAKIGLIINKVDSINGNALDNVVFEIDGKSYTTTNGKIRVDGLSAGIEYTVKEIYNKGYFLLPEFTFTVNKDNEGNYSISSSNEEFANANIENTGNEALIKVNATIPNDKIDLYKLQIEKVDDVDTSKKLEGAKYLVKKDDLKTSAYYYTDENGIINVDDLYVFEEGRGITGKYTIKEIEAPTGYLLNNEEISFVTSKDEYGNLKIDIQNKNNLETFKQVEIDDENKIIKITVQDGSALKLIKKDSVTGDLLPNVGFVIYELDENGQIVDFAKDVEENYIGTKNENGNYVVYTDENGQIKLPLKSGTYKLIEVEFLEGYKTVDNSEIFKVSNGNNIVERYDDYTILEKEVYERIQSTKINYIEDLVDLSIATNSGTNYSGKIFELQRTLNFQDRDSYRNPDDTSYGDLNENNTEETIYEELNNPDGKGFTPIGSFTGIFKGNNHEIQNIYINTNNVVTVTAFNFSNVMDLGLTGEIKAQDANMITGFNNGANIIRNCYSKVNITATRTNEASFMIYGLAPGANKLEKCYYSGNIVVEAPSVKVVGIADSTVEDVFCTGNITVTSTNASNIYGISANKVTNGYFAGSITVNSDVASNIYPVSNNESSSNVYYLDGITNSSSIGITKTSEEMKSDEFVELLGNNFGKDTANSNNGYPIIYDYYKVLEINKIEDLVRLSEGVHYGENYFNEVIKLNCDLDFENDDDYYNPDDTSFGDINGNNEIEGIKTELTTGKGFYPIGDANSIFTGTFDGQNHKLSNFYCNQYNRVINGSTYYCYAGLFGYAQNITVKNLTISGIVGAPNDNDAYSNSFIGGVVAYTYIGNSCFENVHNECNVNGSINSSCEVGGILGYTSTNSPSSSTLNSVSSPTNPQTIFRNCSNKGKIRGEYEVGGIVGEGHINIIFENCSNTGKIESYEYSSGIIGYFTNGIIHFYDCYNTGNVEAKYGYSGGILGETYSSNCYFENCYNTGNISSSTGAYIGGIIGYGSSGTYVITDSYNKGDIFETGSTYYDGYGGIFGELSGGNLTIANCYNEGTISTPNNYNAYSGGILGRAYGGVEIYNCYNTGSITGIARYIGGIVGYTSNSAIIKDCYNTADISTNIPDSSTRYIGGLFGGYSANIDNCYNLGDITAISTVENSNYVYISGLGGGGSSGQVLNSYNIGKITAIDFYQAYAGGLTCLYGNLSNSYNTGDVYVKSREGVACGICGYDSGSGNYTNCYNTGNIEGHFGDYTPQKVAGITAYSGVLVNCYNTGDLKAYGTSSVYVAGLAFCGSLSNSFNTGNIDAVIGGSSYSYIGGLTAGYGDTNISECYNTGDINVYCETTGGLYLGGIAPYRANIVDTYNTGDITLKGSIEYLYFGGILGYYSNSSIKNCYNTGNLYNYNTYDSTNSYVGIIYGYPRNNIDLENVYYLEDIQLISEVFNNQEQYAVSSEQLRSDELYNNINTQENRWIQVENAYPRLDIGSENAPIVNKIVIDNIEATYDITTEIAKNTFGKRLGGTITGEYTEKYDEASKIKLVASLKYGDDLDRDIVITPDEGYKIASIKINKKEIPFEVEDDESYTIPANRFVNVDRNYHIAVTFLEERNFLNLNKINEEGEPLEGAEFSIHEKEVRPEIGEEYGTKVDDDQLFTIPDYSNDVTDEVLGEIVTYSSFCFEEQDGKYVSNNNFRYGIADSYFEIDLTEETGFFQITTNISMTGDYGFIYLTETPDTPATTLDYRRVNELKNTIFAVIDSAVTNQDYKSDWLEGGKKYYIHYKATQGKIMTINSLIVDKISTTVEKTAGTETNPYHVSTLEGRDGYFQWSSSFEMDLTNSTGEYYVIANAKISSEANHDFGYAAVRYGSTYSIPHLSNQEGRWFTISGEIEAKDYRYTLTTGTQNRVYFVYWKDSSGSSGEDKFTVNTVKLVRVDREDVTESVLGEITNGGVDYGFVQQEDGSYANNNVNYSIGGSYIPIDLRGKEGKYVLNLEDYLSYGGSGYSEFSEILNESPDRIDYYTEDDTIVYKGTMQSGKKSIVGIDGGKLYYLHLNAYRSEFYNSATILVKNLKVYSETQDSFGFDEVDGKYVSNNATYENTVAHSYIPIDLTNTYGLYDITVNQTSSHNDRGYIYITKDTNMPDVNSTEGRLVYAGSYYSDGDVKTTVMAGEMYYVHMIYVKDKIGDYYQDTYTVNSITLSLNDSDFYHEDNIHTDANGQIIRGLRYGTFEITETKAPEGYIKADEIVHVMNATSDNHITITDTKKREVIAHYYLKGTGPEYENTPIELAPDEIVYGLAGEEYTTTPKLSIGDYVLTKTGEDYNIPENASGLFTLNTINVYYYYEMDKAEYKVHYFYDNEEDTDVLVTDEAEIGSTLTTYPKKDRRGYSITRTENLPLTITKEGPNEINVYYDKNLYDYRVNYFYNDNYEETVTGQAPYDTVVTSYEDKSREGFVLEKVIPAGENNKANLRITDDVEQNIISVYYRSEYTISTGIVYHDEVMSDGTVRQAVTGGTISGQDEEVYERVLKGNDATKSITISPNIGYSISSITIKTSRDDESGMEVDIERAMDDNGDVVLSTEKGYLKGIQSNIYVEADFRKISSVVVKYLEKDTNTELATQTTINGYANDEFKANILPISFYKFIEIGFGESGNVTDISEFARLSLDTDGSVKGNMYSDTLIITYYYEAIEGGITVEHVSINEEDIENGLTLQSGNVKETETYENYQDLQQIVMRKNYSGYVGVDGPSNSDPKIIILDGDVNSYTANYIENDVLLVRFYYEEQFDITVGVKDHTEGEQQVAGGTIKFEDDSEVETVNDLGSNQKSIIITPEAGYKVKQVSVNDKIVDSTGFIEGENYVLTIPAGYFTKVNEGKEVKAEFERIAARVYIEYIDSDTEELILRELADTGNVGDTYNIELIEMDNYRDDDDHSKLTGYMTEQDIVVKYKYKRLFKVRAGVNSHIEWRHTLIELPKDSDQALTSIVVVGGRVELVDPENPVGGTELTNTVTETVERGATTANNIKITPDTNYKIVSLTKNGDTMTIVDENGFTLDKFENVQEDIDVIVEFERLKGNLVVKYIDMDTQDEIATREEIEGGYEEEYRTYKKTIDNYKYMGVSDNQDGTISAPETIVSFLYKNIRTIPSKIWVKHIVVTAEEIANGLTLDSGTVKDTEELNGFVSLTQNTIRKIFTGDENEDYENLEAVDGPEGTENIVVIDKDTDNYVATYKDEAELEVRYYYQEKNIPISQDAKVIMVYTDAETNEVIGEETVRTGIVGEPYDVTDELIEIPGYRLVEVPSNITGTMDEETRIICYYKKIDAKVVIHYTDVDTGDVIEQEVVYEGKVGDSYDATDKVKEIPGYKPVSIPENIKGTIANEEEIIIYYFKKIEEEKPKDAKVIMVYTDVDTGDVIEQEVVYEGKVGDSYDATDKVKEIPGYKPVSIPENIKGTIANEEEIIIYYFKKIEEEKPKDAKVIMVYTDVDTNKVIEEEIVATGKVGDPYEVKGKEIEGYKPEKTPDNLKGTMDKEEIRIIYYYKKIIKDVVEEKGGIIPEPEIREEIREENVTVVYKGIKTGDNIIEWISALVASTGVLVITIIKKLRNK